MYRYIQQESLTIDPERVWPEYEATSDLPDSESEDDDFFFSGTQFTVKLARLDPPVPLEVRRSWQVQG